MVAQRELLVTQDALRRELANAEAREDFEACERTAEALRATPRTLHEAVREREK